MTPTGSQTVLSGGDQSDPNGVIALPRPNLGPETHQDLGGSLSMWIAIVAFWLSAAFVVLAAGLIVRALRSRSNQKRPQSAGPSPPADRTPRQRAIQTDLQIRERLVHLFDPSWSSKTTQELILACRDESVPEVEKLQTWLVWVDQLKFQPASTPIEPPIFEEDPDPAQSAWKAWIEWAETYVRTLGLEASPTS